jgi:hypothetical protein
MYDSPFRFFELLSKYGADTNNAGWTVGVSGQYRLLYDFYASQIPGELDTVRELLAFDYLRQGRNPSVPDFLSFGLKIGREHVTDLLSNNELIKNHLSYYAGESVKNIMKKVHVAMFSFDICKYIQYETIDKQRTCVVFDYGNKSLDGGVKYFCVGNDLYPFMYC